MSFGGAGLRYDRLSRTVQGNCHEKRQRIHCTGNYQFRDSFRELTARLTLKTCFLVMKSTLSKYQKDQQQQRRMNMRNLKSIIGVGLALLFALGLAACNTTEGVGKDIESVGDSIEDAAD